jgi:hypothetical protein
MIRSLSIALVLVLLLTPCSRSVFAKDAGTQLFLVIYLREKP